MHLHCIKKTLNIEIKVLKKDRQEGWMFRVYQLRQLWTGKILRNISRLSEGLICADTVLLCLREVMGSDRTVTNESLALGHTAAFNRSRCVFSREKNQTISLAYPSVYPKVDSLTDVDRNVSKFMLLIKVYEYGTIYHTLLIDIYSL